MAEARCLVMRLECTSGAVRHPCASVVGALGTCAQLRIPGSSQLYQPRVSHSASRQDSDGKGGSRVLLGGVILALKADSILPKSRQDLFANSCSVSRLLNALLKHRL